MTEAIETATPQAVKVKTKQRVIDGDVHPTVDGSLGALRPYLSESWFKRLEMKGRTTTGKISRFVHPTGSARPDAVPPSGGSPGSDPEWLKSDLMDRNGIDIAILNNLEVAAQASGMAGPDESIALCSAYNDYFLDRWLPVDTRFRYAISVPSQDVRQAVQEIERVGSIAGVAAIALPLLNILIGNRYYHPIYEAAESLGLPILLHQNATEQMIVGGMAGPGWPESYTERRTSIGICTGSALLSSLVFSGTLERFPRLQVVFVEYGFSWVLPLLWRMDTNWRSLRIENPWLERPPTEYVRERVRFTTQPIDEPNDVRQLYRLIEMMPQELLAFATDYPHWDNDMPGSVLHGLSEKVRERIYWQNAADVFRL